MRFLSKKRVLAGLSLIALLLRRRCWPVGRTSPPPHLKSSARSRIITEIEKQTGAAVSLKTFKWNFWNQKFRLEDLTLHGLEPPEENPLAHIDRVDIGFNFRTLIDKRIDLLS